MTTKNIKCNFSSVFAQFNTIEEITEVANNICAQVKTTYEARKAELEEETATAEAVVEVEVMDEAKPEDKPKKESKKGDKKSRAKEMAEKFKKEKAESKTDGKKETKAENKPKKEAGKESKNETSDDLIAVTDTAAIKKLGLTFKKYNDKCYVLRGETKPLRKVLKEEFKGVYNSRLTGGEGWVISAKHAENCAKALGLKLSA